MTSSLKIGVGAQTLLEQSAGMTSYAFGLLSEILRQDKSNFYDFLLFRSFPKKPEYMFGMGKNFSYRYQRFFPFRLFHKLYKWEIGIPLDLFFGSHDLYFFPNFVIYPHLGGKNIVVVPDLTFEKVPQYVDRQNVEFLKKFVPPSVAKADHIVTISNYTKGDLIQTYKVPDRKITVAYPGVDPVNFRPRGLEEIAAIKRKYAIEKPFILYLGTLEPRKNIPSILKAYAGLKNRQEYSLVLAGKKGWLYEEIFQTVRKLGIEKEVIFTGYIPDDDRPILMAAAQLFVFPSFFEGFGMPVVEAQACGTPVVTSNTTSLPEAVGEGAILVDPENTNELKEAMEKILSSPKIANQLKEKGLQNARRFNWASSARKVIEIFNRLSKM